MAKPRSISGRKPKDPMYIFGTSEEVAQRLNDEALFNAGGDPQDHHPNFQQIAPKQGAGNVNRAPLGHKSGDFKVSWGPGKI